MALGVGVDKWKDDEGGVILLGSFYKSAYVESYE